MKIAPRALIALSVAILPGLASAATIQLTNADFSGGTNPLGTGWLQVNGGGTGGRPSNYARIVPMVDYTAQLISRLSR